MESSDGDVHTLVQWRRQAEARGSGTRRRREVAALGCDARRQCEAAARGSSARLQREAPAQGSGARQRCETASLRCGRVVTAQAQDTGTALGMVRPAERGCASGAALEKSGVSGAHPVQI